MFDTPDMIDRVLRNAMRIKVLINGTYLPATYEDRKLFFISPTTEVMNIYPVKRLDRVTFDYDAATWLVVPK